MANSYSSGGVNITTDVYKPAGPANKAAIVLVYGSDGLIDNKNGLWATMIEEDARGLAQKGFHALVPDYFLRTNTPAGSIDYKNGGLATVDAYAGKWETTIADAVQYARTLAGIDPSRIGLVGYSLGAFLSLRLRTHARAVVAFYPPQLGDLGAATTPGLPIQIPYAENDLFTKESQTKQFVDELRKQGAVVDSKCYTKATHGFSGGPDNATARTQSQAKMFEFFKASL
jgi:dienelactone hydrolase